MLKKVKKENNIFLSDITPFSPEIFSAKKPHFYEKSVQDIFLSFRTTDTNCFFFSLNTVSHLN